MPAWHGQPQKTRYAFTASGSATVFGAASNNPPVWQSVPHITFFVGITSTFPISGTYQSNNYVTDADFDTIVITKNNVFVQGVTWDGGKFTSNGTGSQTTVTGHILTADDGHNSNVQSSAFQIVIIPGAVSWTSVPSVSFVEGSTTAYSLGQNILNYNAATDSFAVTPGYTLPSWLSLSGTGNVNLTPNGNQVDGDDFDDTPGIKIDVRRSGGAWVSSSAFGVTVTAAQVYPGSISDLAYEGPAYTTAFVPWTDPQYGDVGGMMVGKHGNIQFCPLDSKFYIHGGDGSYPDAPPPGNSGVTQFFRFALTVGNTRMANDLFHPYWGGTGLTYPVGSDNVPFHWDRNRGCFWSVGGFGWDHTTVPKYIGTPRRGGPDVWRFWVSNLTGKQGQWELVTPAASLTYAAHSEGMNGIYHARTDCLMWMGSGSVGGHRIVWYKCDTGAMGYLNYYTIISGVNPNANPLEVQQHPSIWDEVRDEFIWQDFYPGGASDSPGYAGLYGVSLAAFNPATTPNNAHVDNRKIYQGFRAPGVTLNGQRPLFIRGRKLYAFGAPYGAFSEAGNIGGNGLGFLEVDLDDNTQVAESAQPYFALLDVASPDLSQPDPLLRYKAAAINEGSYSPDADVMMTTQHNPTPGVRGLSVPLIFKWTPPSWTPPAGEARQITLDYLGDAGNTLTSVKPTVPAKIGLGFGGWMSSCIATQHNTNGLQLFMSGGDGDYCGNEVIAFDWDSRRYFRLSDPFTAMSGVPPFGGPDIDAATGTSSASYWNNDDGEHGPRVADDFVGLFPVVGAVNGSGTQATQPATAHMYDSMCYVPAKWIGNKRGALVRAVTSVSYTQRSDGRAHYFDLDNYRWGRLSSNRVGGTTQAATVAYDDEAGRIYHQSGYLKLADRVQVAQTWNGGSFPLPASGVCTSFDPVTRLWLWVTGGGTIGGIDVDNAVSLGGVHTNIQSLSVSGSNLWPSDLIQYGALEFCSWLDCFYYYNFSSAGEDQTYSQFIWKIQPPRPNGANTTTAQGLSGTWTITRVAIEGDTILTSGGVSSVKLMHKMRAVAPLKCLAIQLNPNDRPYLYKPV